MRLLPPQVDCTEYGAHLNPAVDQLRQTIARAFWLKLIGTPTFIGAFLFGYFYVLHRPTGEVTIMPLTVLDRWIGFEPLAMWPYVSLWLYVSLPPALLGSRREVIMYGISIALLCLVGLSIFLMWPTAVPPADIDWARHPSLALLKGLDKAANACPSLHVATALYSAIWLHVLMHRLDASSKWLIANWVWCTAILWSTLATRQHVAVDLYAGIALALAVAWLFLVPGQRFWR